jgi:quinol monooxygenase YgiN
MSRIQTIESTPPYIGKFIKDNMKQLSDIHEESIKEHGVGCLGFICSQTENKMDVFFMNEEMMLKQLQKESWEQLKKTINDKMLFLVKDLDINSIFLVYI